MQVSLASVPVSPTLYLPLSYRKPLKLFVVDSSTEK